MPDMSQLKDTLQRNRTAIRFKVRMRYRKLASVRGADQQCYLCAASQQKNDQRHSRCCVLSLPWAWF